MSHQNDDTEAFQLFVLILLIIGVLYLFSLL